jgi:hypothetical protein
MEENVKKAMDEVRKSLDESFGAGMAARILFSAMDAVNAPVIGLTREKLLDLANAICSDSRVKEMWGDFGVKEKLIRWEKLVS